MSFRRIRWDAAWWLLLVAFLLRVAYAIFTWVQTGAKLDFDDEKLHWELARSIVERGVMVSEDGRFAPRMPLYPVFLAAFAWLGQWGILAARVAQCMLSAMIAFVAFRFVSAACSRIAARWIALAICLDPFAIFFSRLLLTESIFSLQLVTFAACAWAVARDTTFWRRRTRFGFVALGIALIMTRSEAIGFVIAVWIATLTFALGPRSRVAGLIAISAISLGCVFIPWGQRNRAVIGDFAWLSANGGLTLYDAQGPQAKGDSDQSFLKRMPEIASLPEARRDAQLRRLAWEQMTANPARVGTLAITKLQRTWNPLPNNADYRSGTTAYIGAAYSVGLIMAATTGLIFALRRSPPNRAGWPYLPLVWLPLIYFTLVTCIFIGSVRYRVPVMPFLALAATPLFVRHRPPTATTSGTSAPADRNRR